MKTIILLSSLALFACTKKATLDTEHIKEPVEDAEQTGIVPENDMCICTKEFRPVCGSDGNTYGNPCMAGCADVTEYTEGECQE